MKQDVSKTRMPFQWARVAGATLCLALLCGCGTMLANVGQIADDQSRYLVKGALGETAAQRELAVRIVNAELASRLQTFQFANDTRELVSWRKRQHSLEEPVAINSESYKRSPELRNVSDLNKVALYVSQHPEALKLEGAKLSEQWAAALKEATEKAGKLDGERKQALKDAEAAATAKDYLKALLAYAVALEIVPGEKEVSAKAVQAAGDAWKLVKDGMEKTVLSKTESAIANPAEWAAFERAIVAGQDSLLVYLKSVNAAKLGGMGVLTEERRKEAGALLQQSSAALGGLWTRQGESLVAGSDYWAFYKLIASRLESAETRVAIKGGPLADRVKGLYVNYLAAGMKHFIDTASAAYDRDQYGVSYVFCLMAEELLDFAKAKKLVVPPEAEDLLGFARSIEKDATEKVAAQHRRRLLILDFLPAVTEEGGQVAYQARTLCNKKYEAPNSLAWRLSVPQGKILTQNMLEPLDPLDTIISGEIKEITVNTLPVREYDQEFIEVGSENIIEVVNPMFKIRKNEPRTIWQQEMAKFYRVKREHKKEGVLSLLLSGEKPDAPAVSLLSLTERFPSERLPLKELTMQSEEIAFANPIPGTPRTAAVPDDLKADPYPQSVPVRLSSDKEIQKAVLEFALQEIDHAIEKQVVQYPITGIAARAVEARRGGDATVAAEQWGQFLLYVRQLTEATLADSEKESITWTALRAKLESNLAAWADARWKGLSAAVLKELTDLWATATAEALRTVSPPAE